MDDRTFTPRLCAQLQKALDEDKLPHGALGRLIALKGCIDGATDAAERIMIKLATVPAFHVRIQMINAKADFPDLCSSCLALMRPFFEAFAKIKSSKHMETILGVSLGSVMPNFS